MTSRTSLTTLRDRPARLVAPDGSVDVRLVGLTDLVLHLRMAETPPPLKDDVRVRLLGDGAILGSVQFLVRAVTALREGDHVDVMLRVQKIFVGADEITAARLLRELLPNHELSPTAFDQVPRGVIYTCGPTPRSTREMIARALGHADPGEPPAEPDEPARPATSPGTTPGTTPGRVHQPLLHHTHDVRIPLLLHVGGQRMPAVAYRASLDGRRCFLTAVGEPPTFGSRVDLTVDLHGTGRVDRALLVGSVAWTSACDGMFAAAIRTSPQTNETHLARWSASLLPAVRFQRERTHGIEARGAESGCPPEDATAQACLLHREQRQADQKRDRRVVTQPLGLAGGSSFARFRPH